LEAIQDDDNFETNFDENGLPIRGEARPQTLTADRIAALQRRFGVDDCDDTLAEESYIDETRSVARSVLSENRDLAAVSVPCLIVHLCVHLITSCISQVHSQRSVAAIAAKKIETEKNSNEAKLNYPKIVTHSDDEGTRLANKKNIQNLPYINRNPSV
jgi:hypothetical protein